MQKLRNATLVFLIKKAQGKITKICLAMKKRGFGSGRWNGVGGKVQEDQNESIEDAAKREVKEEIGVVVEKLNKVAELVFYFSNNQEWNQLVHVYFAESWTGEPVETEEMRPKWFSISKIPLLDNMWPDDKFWLPKVLKGDLVKAKFTFENNDIILEKEVMAVDVLRN
ncbi:MAG: 8-oxo-dGTP diphosphatase [Patescibacteria group bacterium]